MASTLGAVGDTVAAKAPPRRLGRDDDMAGITAFLASAAATYIAGTIIPVDGWHRHDRHTYLSVGARLYERPAAS